MIEGTILLMVNMSNFTNTVNTKHWRKSPDFLKKTTQFYELLSYEKVYQLCATCIQHIFNLFGLSLNSANIIHEYCSSVHPSMLMPG